MSKSLILTHVAAFSFLNVGKHHAPPRNQKRVVGRIAGSRKIKIYWVGWNRVDADQILPFLAIQGPLSFTFFAWVYLSVSFKKKGLLESSHYSRCVIHIHLWNMELKSIVGVGNQGSTFQANSIGIQLQPILVKHAN